MTDLPRPQPPIVLISPAMAIGSRFYRPLVAEFERCGWAAQALPRRGFEQDDAPASRRRDWSYRDQIDDIERAVEQARRADPARPVLLLGHSLGGQVAVGHQTTENAVDGLITVGTSLPYWRTYPGIGLLAMGLVTPVVTYAFGYLPRPFFGAPGARTMTREWARMVVTGKPPFAVPAPLRLSALIVSLDADDLAPAASIDRFAERIFNPDKMTRWHYRADDANAETSDDHIGWVRGSGDIVEKVVAWWDTLSTTPTTSTPEYFTKENATHE